ncbi:MAG: type VII secretion-associated protein [Mycobacterium sp.]
MSDAVVVVGPKAIGGPGAVDPELASAALDGIDDDLALVEDRVLPVDELWAGVLRSAMGGPCDTAMLICPSWWANSRVDLVTAAARESTANPVVLRRPDLLTSDPIVVELAPELVVVHADGQRHAIARPGPSAGVVDAVLACVRGLDAVTIDVPSGLARFGAELSVALRRTGIDVTTVDDHALVRAARTQPRAPRVDDVPVWRRVATPRAAAVAVAVLSVTALSAVAVGMRARPVDAGDATWLVEGRIAVEVPARWTVDRITSGPGSARLQVVSPSDREEVIHVTQSGLPGTQTLDAAAETLRAALAEEPEGVFVEFSAHGERARRPAVTYREIRPDRHIDWTVLIDAGVRIAIGCQGAAEQPGPVQQCDRAIGSAHAVARK